MPVQMGSSVRLALVNIGVMAIVVGILAWTPAFLHDQRGASLAVAAYLTAGIGVAQMIGNVVGAAAMARWGKPFVLLTGMAVMFAATSKLKPCAFLAVDDSPEPEVESETEDSSDISVDGE